MKSTRKIEKQIERRTFVRGVLEGKLYGDVDKRKSDFNRENFYDLEFYDAEITALPEDIRKYDQGGEYEEFKAEVCFPTRLPNPTKLQIASPSGECELYLVRLEEPKVRDIILEKQVYDESEVFTTLRGEISGYLRHYETVIEEIEVLAPDPLEDSQTRKALVPEFPMENDESTPTIDLESESTIDKDQNHELLDKTSSIDDLNSRDLAENTEPNIRHLGRREKIAGIFSSPIRSVTEHLVRPVAYWADEKFLHFGQFYRYPKTQVLRFAKLLGPLYSVDKFLSLKGCATTIVIATSLLILSTYISVGMLLVFSIAVGLLSWLAASGGLAVGVALIAVGFLFALTRQLSVRLQWVIPALILAVAILASLTNC